MLPLDNTFLPVVFFALSTSVFAADVPAMENRPYFTTRIINNDRVRESITLSFLLHAPKNMKFPVYYLENPYCSFIVHSVFADGVEVPPHIGVPNPVPTTHIIDAETDCFAHSITLHKHEEDEVGMNDGNASNPGKGEFYQFDAVIDESMLQHVFRIPVNVKEIRVVYSGLYYTEDRGVFHAPTQYTARFMLDGIQWMKKNTDAPSGIKSIEVLDQDAFFLPWRRSRFR